MKYKTIRALPSFKQYLKENKITEQDLSDITGYSTGAMHRFINRKSGSRGMLKVIASELEINEDLIAEIVYI